jgi:acetyltransferase-like isoleucine patch superfamily enzyme
MKRFLKRLFRHQALEHGRFVGLWRRLGRPNLEDWTEYLRRHGRFHAFGENCAMSPDTHFGDPELISIGSNVRIAGAFLACHDGSVNMINRAFGLRLDSVGPIRIGDNVFIGYGAIVLPNVTIGSNTIIAAGSVVSRDIEGDCVAAGAPSRKVAELGDHVARLAARNAAFPWRPLIEARKAEFDPAMEPELRRQRITHFFDAGIDGRTA